MHKLTHLPVGLTRYEALLVSGGLQLWYLLSSIAPWFLVDTVGRRKLFIIGSTGMGMCMALSAVFVGIGTKGLGIAAVVSIPYTPTLTASHLG